MFLDLHTECSVNVLLVDSGVKITPGVIFSSKNYSSISTPSVVLIFTPFYSWS